MRTTYKSYTNTSSSINNSGLPSATDAGNYFYLPALGYYSFGLLDNVGMGGFYWSSSASPQNSGFASQLYFSYGNVSVYDSYSGNGYRVGGVE